MHRQFGQSNSAEISVFEISNTLSSDSLARITLSRGEKSWKIACAVHYFAVLIWIGTTFPGDSSNLEEITIPSHAEYITAMYFNNGCDRLVSYGLRSTKWWAIPSGEMLESISYLAGVRAIAIAFTENNAKIMSASDDEFIRILYQH